MYQPRTVINIFILGARKQGQGLATNNATNQPKFVEKVEKFRLLPKPRRLRDLQNYISLRTERKIVVTCKNCPRAKKKREKHNNIYFLSFNFFSLDILKKENVSNVGKQ